MFDMKATRAKQMADELKFHPIADLFPMMSADELGVLCFDIKSHGQHEPIMLAPNENGEMMIADGRNRYKACRSLGIEPVTREWTGDGDLLDIVVSLNLKRRHLNESQRAMVAFKLANTKQGERTDLPQIRGKLSQTAAAKLLSVSERSVSDASKVKTKGIPELTERVEAGEMSVSQAATIASMSPMKQKKLIKRGRAGQRRMITKLKTQSLRQTSKGYGTCLYCNHEATWTDDSVSAFAQRVEQRAREAERAGRASKHYGNYFEGIAFEIEEEKRAAAARTSYDKIFAAIDGGNEKDDLENQCAWKNDIQRMTGIPWPEFNALIATMLDLNMIEIILQGGKTDGARGARKELVRRSTKANDSELVYEMDEDFPEKDVYLEQWP